MKFKANNVDLERQRALMCEFCSSSAEALFLLASGGGGGREGKNSTVSREIDFICFDA